MEKAIPTHAVKAVIRNSQGGILFLRRDGKSRADGQSNWDLPGGLVELGEDDKTALAREIAEELNVAAVVGNELGKWTFYRPFDDKTIAVTNYEVTVGINNVDGLTLSAEHTAAKFVNPASLPALDVKDRSIFAALGE